MKKIKVHFVCLGNTYRSRLAEAYAKSLNLEGFEFSSSGLSAASSPQSLPLHTSSVVAKHNLAPFLSGGPQQTTAELLEPQDLIVFMHHDLYRDAVAAFGLDTRKCMYWSVGDLWQSLLKSEIKASDEAGIVRLAEETFEVIKYYVDNLAPELTGTDWVDIVDENNQELGFRSSMDLANRHGLWHRSVHAMIITPDGQFVAEKRSKTIIFDPGLIDISMGGGIDAGEEPMAALLRELKEEMGLTITDDQAHLLEVRKASNYHPKFKRYTRGFIYSYLVRLTEIDPLFKLQTSEVSEMRLLSSSQVKKLIRNHKLKKLGRLSYQYKFYKDTLRLAEKIKPTS